MSKLKLVLLIILAVVLVDFAFENAPAGAGDQTLQISVGGTAPVSGGLPQPGGGSGDRLGRPWLENQAEAAGSPGGAKPLQPSNSRNPRPARTPTRPSKRVSASKT